MKTDILIIGAGLMGTASARELSRYKYLDITLIEKGSDVCSGTSKATSAIVHSGWDLSPGTKKAELGIKGNRMYGDYCAELEVEFKRIGSLFIAFNEDDLKEVKGGIENAKKLGVDARLVEKEELHQMEPYLSEDAIAALYAKDCGIVSSFELNIALLENAMDNGVKFIKECPALAAKKEGDSWIVSTPKGDIEAKYIINSTGVYSDEIARLFGDDTYTVGAYKGEEYLFDSSLSYMINHVYETLSAGVDLLPTTHGNIMMGTTRYLVDKNDFDTTREHYVDIIKNAKKVLPALPERQLITSFAGQRAINNLTNDYLIGISEKNPDLLNVSVGSPGIFAVPAIAEEVAKIVNENWMKLEKRDDFNPHREAIPDFKALSNEEREALIAKDARYGRVICRCNTITEGQIVEAIRRGATTLDGIKYRVRAGMGRCQGGFCTPRVIRIMERELGVEVTELTKKGKGSELMPYRVKDFLKGGGDK